MWLNRRGTIPLILAVIAVSTVDVIISAVVLPRPPSSPNHIRNDYEVTDDKVYSEKGYQNPLMHSTNVEKPSTEDYRLVEIEIPDSENMDLIGAVVQDTEGKEAFPKPEVIAHSIYGVRKIGGLPPNMKIEDFDSDEEEKRVLLGPPRVFNEKLYYLKSSRPNVFVNVRGRSGNYRKETTEPRTVVIYRPSEATQQTTKPFDERRTLRGSIGRPKKFQPTSVLPSGEQAYPVTEFETKVKGHILVYAPEDDTLTTQNTLVTSSELPRQIPPPPSKIPIRTSFVQTTPVQRYATRRTDILPGYSFNED